LIDGRASCLLTRDPPIVRLERPLAMPRLFVALRPPPPVRQRLRALGTGIPGARWQDDEQLHLTLRFIGDIDRPLAEDVAAALGGVHAPVPAVSITGVGRFEHRG
ncbi:2'-5' RNA ligase family protein, partial [Aestuariibaculum lutulentum]